MKLRSLHRTVEILFSPFFLITACTGICLLWRKAEIYGKETKSLLLGMHNWEIAAQYVGGVLAAGLIFMALTGITLYIQAARKKR